MIDPHSAVRLVAAICGCGIAINSLELLAERDVLRPTGLLGLRAEIYHERSIIPGQLCRPNLALIILLIRLIAAIALVTAALRGARLDVWLILLAASSVYTAWLKVFGSDGADQMNLIIVLSLTGAVLVGESAFDVALWFIAAQALLAYSTAGVAKLFSPEWRTGLAIPRIVNTNSYGIPGLSPWLTRTPLMGKIASWGTIAFELAMVSILVAPRPIVLGLLVVAGSFHIATAVIMGLNDFVWAFTATFPALLFLSDSINTSVL